MRTGKWDGKNSGETPTAKSKIDHFMKVMILTIRRLDRVTNVVVESHEEFFKRITKIDRNLICKLGQSELEELMSENLKVALERKTRHHQNKGFFRETGHNAVKFTKNILEYFEAYSGIVEIMKGADQQYGGVAYATISLLLIVRAGFVRPNVD